MRRRPVIIPAVAAALVATVAVTVPSFAADDDPDRDCVGSYDYNRDVSGSVRRVHNENSVSMSFDWIHLRANPGAEIEICLDFDDDVRGTGKLVFYADANPEPRQLQNEPGTGRLIMGAAVPEDGWFRIWAPLEASQLREQFILHAKGDIIDLGTG